MATLTPEPYNLIPGVKWQEYHQLHPDATWDAMTMKIPQEKQLRLVVPGGHAYYYVVDKDYTTLQWIPVGEQWQANAEFIANLKPQEIRKRIENDLKLRRTFETLMYPPKKKEKEHG